MAKAKIDERRLADLVNAIKPDGKKMTQQEMADELGVTRGAIAQRVKKLNPELIKTRSTKQFREMKADILVELQQEFVKYLTPTKIKQLSARQIVASLESLDKLERLERGMSTENHAHLHKAENLPIEIQETLLAAIKDLTTKRLEDARAKDLNDRY